MPSPIAVFCVLAFFGTLTAHAHQVAAFDCDKAVTSKGVDGSFNGSLHGSFNGMLRSFTRRLNQATTSIAVAVAQAASAGNGEAIAMLSRLFKARTPKAWLLGGFQTRALQNPASTSRALAFAFGQNGITVPTSALTAATASAQRRGGPANEAFASALAQATSQSPALRQSLFPALPTGFLTQPEIARRFPDLRTGGRRSMLQAVAVAAANANANGAVASAVAVAATNGNGLAIAIAISVSSNCAGWNTAVTSGLAQAYSTNPATTERSLAQAVAQAQALGAASAVAATAALAASGGAAQQTLWTNALAQAGAQNPNAIAQLLPQLPPSLQQAPQLRSFTAGGAGGQGNRMLNQFIQTLRRAVQKMKRRTAALKLPEQCDQLTPPNCSGPLTAHAEKQSTTLPVPLDAGPADCDESAMASTPAMPAAEYKSWAGAAANVQSLPSSSGKLLQLFLGCAHPQQEAAAMHTQPALSAASPLASTTFSHPSIHHGVTAVDPTPSSIVTMPSHSPFHPPSTTSGSSSTPDATYRLWHRAATGLRTELDQDECPTSLSVGANVCMPAEDRSSLFCSLSEVPAAAARKAHGQPRCPSLGPPFEPDQKYLLAATIQSRVQSRLLNVSPQAPHGQPSNLGGRRLAHSRSTFCVLESSQEWQAKYAEGRPQTFPKSFPRAAQHMLMQAARPQPRSSVPSQAAGAGVSRHAGQAHMMPSIQHLRTVAGLLHQRHMGASASTSSSAFLKLLGSGGAGDAGSDSSPTAASAMAAEESRPSTSRTMQAVLNSQGAGTAPRGSLRRLGASPSWSVYTTSTDYAALKATRINATSDGPLQPLVSVMECGLEGPDAPGASERASACERSYVTKVLMQGLAGKLGLSPNSTAAAGAAGSNAATEVSHVSTLGGEEAALTPLSAVESGQVLRPPGLAGGAGSERRVARARATFSVLESSQEWRAKQASLAVASRAPGAHLAYPRTSRHSRMACQPVVRSEEEEGWDLALALVPALATDGQCGTPAPDPCTLDTLDAKLGPNPRERAVEREAPHVGKSMTQVVHGPLYVGHQHIPLAQRFFAQPVDAAAAQRWQELDRVKAGTSLVPNLKHISATRATWDAVWEVYLDPTQDRALEQFLKKLEEEMAEVAMKRHGRAKQLVVFIGAASIGTRGGWGPDAVVRACCKVVCRPRGTDQRRGRVVLVDEHRTSRVSSAVNGQQPWERQLNKRRVTRPADSKPSAGQVEQRLLRPAWSQQLAPRKPPQAPCSSQATTQPAAASEPGPSTPPPTKRSKRTKAEQTAEPTQPTKGKGKAAKAKSEPQPGSDEHAAYWDAKWRPLELCYWPEQGKLPAKGKEYPGLGYKRVRDKPPKAQQQQQQQQQCAPYLELFSAYN
ncbi:hypothetical protein QJQ45_011911 [Haematococcus lacustris]|nr:hypothetical protein QJQ45_011911 [Haematococcus lacustris]